MTSKIPCTNPAHRVKTHLAGTTAAMECQAGERAYGGKSQGKISATPPSSALQTPSFVSRPDAVAVFPGGEVVRSTEYEGALHVNNDQVQSAADELGLSVDQLAYPIYRNPEGQLWIAGKDEGGRPESILLSDLSDQDDEDDLAYSAARAAYADAGSRSAMEEAAWNHYPRSGYRGR